jgi:hypothetical protein
MRARSCLSSLARCRARTRSFSRSISAAMSSLRCRCRARSRSISTSISRSRSGPACRQTSCAHRKSPQGARGRHALPARRYANKAGSRAGRAGRYARNPTVCKTAPTALKVSLSLMLALLLLLVLTLLQVLRRQPAPSPHPSIGCLRHRVVPAFNDVVAAKSDLSETCSRHRREARHDAARLG